MPNLTRLEFRYCASDVASAQRMRFLRSAQLKVILLLWLVSLLYVAAPLLVPQWFKPGPYTSWGLVIEICLAYGVTLLVLILVTPWADFYINRFWRLPLEFQYNEKHLRLSVTGKQGGLRLGWKQIQRVEENARVFILFYGTANKFIILPKGIFSRPQDDRRFRELLSQRAVLVDTGEEA
jgi:YcxB-like protein